MKEEYRWPIFEIVLGSGSNGHNSEGGGSMRCVSLEQKPIVLLLIACSVFPACSRTPAGASNANSSTASNVVPGPPWTGLLKGDVITYDGTIGNDEIEISLKKESTSGDIINIEGVGAYKNGGSDFFIKGYVSGDDHIITIDKFNDLFGGAKFVSDTKIEGGLSKVNESTRTLLLAEKQRSQDAQLSARIDKVAKQTPPETEPQEVALSIEERLQKEAEAQAEAFWKKAVIKCGDTYYWHIGAYYEGKGNYSYRVNGTYHAPAQLTEAQKLNGVDPQPEEWDGTLQVIFPAGREMAVVYGDPSWRDNYEFPLMHIKKIKGQWRLYGESQYGFLHFVPIKNCSEIPGVGHQGDNSSSGCEHSLGSAIKAKWIQAGGGQGVLGCPDMDETAATQSPQGTSGRYVDFKGGKGYDPGTIHLSTSGRYRSTAFITRGAIFALYKSLGGSSSWLGFPISDEHDSPGGRRSDFEGGYIYWNAQTGQTKAFRN